MQMCDLSWIAVHFIRCMEYKDCLFLNAQLEFFLFVIIIYKCWNMLEPLSVLCALIYNVQQLIYNNPDRTFKINERFKELF